MFPPPLTCNLIDVSTFRFLEHFRNAHKNFVGAFEKKVHLKKRRFVRMGLEYSDQSSIFELKLFRPKAALNYQHYGFVTLVFVTKRVRFGGRI